MKKATSGVLTVALLLAGLWFSHRPIMEGRHLYVHGDLGDARYVNLLLEHSYSFLVKGWPESFWNPPWAFYPDVGVTAFSDTMLSSAPLYIPSRLLGFSPLGAFQIWFLLTSLANFGASFWFLRRLGCTTLAAAAGSFLFSFSMPGSALLGHAQLHARFFIPLSLGFLHMGLSADRRSGRIVTMAAAGAFAAFQFWSSAYLGWFFAFAMIATLVGLVARPRTLMLFASRVKQDITATFVALATFCAAVVPLALHYRAAAAARTWAETLRYISTPDALLHAHPGSYVYGWSAFQSSSDVLFAGFIVLGMPILFAIAPERGETSALRRLGLACVVTISILLAVSVRWGDMALWQYVHDFVPGAGHIRAVGRIGLLVLTAAGILTAITLSMWERSRPAGFWIALARSVGIVAENAHRNRGAFNKERHFARVEKVKAALRAQGHCVVFYAQRAAGNVPVITHLDAMWVSMETHIPTANGYSGTVPPGWDFEGSATRHQIIARLRAHGVMQDRVPDSGVCVVQQTID